MTVSNIAPLAYSEIRDFTADWYSKLDVHAPVEEYASLLADEKLELRFPEGTFTGFEGYKEWYDNVIGIFFDEVHTVKKAEPKPLGNNQFEVKVVVKWEASVWNPPAANSERIILDAYQTWIIERSPETEKPIIVTYIVDSMEYYEGSAKL